MRLKTSSERAARVRLEAVLSNGNHLDDCCATHQQDAISRMVSRMPQARDACKYARTSVPSFMLRHDGLVLQHVEVSLHIRRQVVRERYSLLLSGSLGKLGPVSRRCVLPARTT